MKILLLTAMFSNAAFATYFVAGFSSNYGVVAIDSREVEGKIISDRHCKIQPLSHDAFFFSRGVTSAIDNNVRILDAGDIARRVYLKVGTTNFSELAREWAVQMEDAYNKYPAHYARSAVGGVMANGFFVGIDAGGNVAFSAQTIRHQPHGATPFASVPEPVLFSEPGLGPRYSGGYHEILREFWNDGETERARQILAQLQVKRRGPDAVAARYSAYVAAVRDWSGDKGIGGEIATVILERGKGWRWFQRPDFCPEN